MYSVGVTKQNEWGLGLGLGVWGLGVRGLVWGVFGVKGVFRYENSL